MKNILVIGSVNMDMVITTERIPCLGETVIGGEFRTLPGGKGGNQALAAAKLGGKVKMMCRVGNDIYGETLIQNLQEYGIETAQDCSVQTNSGIAMITVCGGDNSIILSQGANAEWTTEFIDANLDMIKWADILLLQFEIPMETVLYAAEKAKENDCVVLINPAPMLPVPSELLQYTDIFVPNQYEAGHLLGKTIETLEEGKAAVSELFKSGIGQIIITMGADGALYNVGNEIRHQSIFRVPAVDTTAAGDSFIAGVCVGLCRGYSIDKAVLFATAVSAITVSSMGASSSLPTAVQVNDFLNQRNLCFHLS